MNLWNKECEKKFFEVYLNLKIPPEKLFYQTSDDRYLAYYPKNYRGKKLTLQSRNSFIGAYTESWVKELLEPIVKDYGYYVVLGAICEEIELTTKSPADVAICKTPSKFQKPENILAIFEVKMSIVWNWEYNPKNNEIMEIGDFTQHIGNPSLLRSDSMLKAIGKAINIRASSLKASRIPIIIIGNTPITESYYKKVDNLKKMGIIQGFWSLNPNPLNNNFSKYNIKKTEFEGFYRFDTYEELKDKVLSLISTELQFFGGMLSKKELGRLIEYANKGKTYEEKALKFLEYLWGEKIEEK